MKLYNIAMAALYATISMAAPNIGNVRANILTPLLEQTLPPHKCCPSNSGTPDKPEVIPEFKCCLANTEICATGELFLAHQQSLML